VCTCVFFNVEINLMLQFEVFNNSSLDSSVEQKNVHSFSHSLLPFPVTLNKDKKTPNRTRQISKMNLPRVVSHKTFYRCN
jgi:hypothetical protein